MSYIRPIMIALPGLLASVAAVVLAVVLLLPSGPGEALAPAPEVTEFVSDAEFPVSVAFAPDGRLFYNELRTGMVRVVEGGQLQATPFATLFFITKAVLTSPWGLFLAAGRFLER